MVIKTTKYSVFKGELLNQSFHDAPSTTALSFAGKTSESVLKHMRSSVIDFCLSEPLTRANKKVISSVLRNIKVGTHEGTSPCDWSLRLVPCSVYTKEIVAGTSPLKT